MEKERVTEREQVSVFLEDRPGSLAEVIRILAEANIEIEALLFTESNGLKVLRLVVDDHDGARRVLLDCGFIVGRSKVLVIEGLQKLREVLRLLQKEQIDISYMYTSKKAFEGGLLYVLKKSSKR